MYNHLVLAKQLAALLAKARGKKEEFDIFKEIVIASSEGKQREKDDLIYLVKLAYKLQGKGKTRKRELSEILQIIEDKNSYFKY